ncbi:MAG TPA: helix-turn-helix transcriptional regulator [Roseiarcus sp.]|nr:helix-turn-helix transcriptional regulator [Roseiarcus sp.]
MVRNARIDAFDHVPRPVIAIGNDYPSGHVVLPHRHRRSQLLYGASGAVIFAAEQSAWVMPPQGGMWIPAGVTHEVRMLGAFSARSLYLEPEVAQGMPDHCQVVAISPFMRSLLAEAVDLPADYDLGGRGGALMALVLHEIRRLPALPLSLPFPTHGALAERCRAFLEKPSPHATIDAWSEALGVSRRTFTRLIKRETGLSFALWRQRACLVAALPRLTAGEKVTEVALDLGYDNPAAFTTMFKRVLGASPRNYLRENG